MFKFELIIKYKSLSLARLGSAWLGLAWFISQAKLELNIKYKLNFNMRFNISILSSLYHVYHLAYLVWMSGLNL